MTVVHTIASLAPEAGGPARTIPPLCKALGAHHVTASVLSMDGKRGPIEIVRYRRALRSLAQGETPCIIHDNGLWGLTNHTAAAVARRANTPLVVTPHGMLAPWALKYKKWKKRLAWQLYQRRNLNTAVLLHATSEREAQDLRTLGLRQPIAVIPNGIDVPAAVEACEPARAAEERTVLFLSRLHEKKGLLNLVEAWALLRPQGWQLVVAGPDEDGHRSVVEEAVAAAGLQRCVRFVGPVRDADKWEFYRQADLFVLPTMGENFGLVVPEALACGTPVITTRGAPWQELEAHQCGWWIEIGTRPLREALREAMALSDAARRAMGRRGRALVEKRYTWTRAAADMRAVYAWVLGSGSRPDCIHFA